MTNDSKTAPNSGERAVAHEDRTPRAAETKPSFETTELVMFLVVAIGIIITASVIGNGAAVARTASTPCRPRS